MVDVVDVKLFSSEMSMLKEARGVRSELTSTINVKSDAIGTMTSNVLGAITMNGSESSRQP